LLKNKLLRAYISKGTEHVIKIRAVQLSTSQEKLIGHILKEWAGKSTMDDKNYLTAQEDLRQYAKH
jgi:hypothetical protein